MAKILKTSTVEEMGKQGHNDVDLLVKNVFHNRGLTCAQTVFTYTLTQTLTHDTLTVPLFSPPRQMFHN